MSGEKVTRKLWEIANDLRDLAFRMEEFSELTPELEAELDALQGDFGQKLEQCSKMAAFLDTCAESVGKEAKRLTKRASANKTAAESLRKYMLRQLQNLRLEEFALPDGSRRWARAQTPGRVVITDERCLPETLGTKTMAWDLTKIRDAIKRGQLPGGGAEIVPGESLREY